MAMIHAQVSDIQKSEVPPEELEEDSLLVCSPTVLGLGLDDKKWRKGSQIAHKDVDVNAAQLNLPSPILARSNGIRHPSTPSRLSDACRSK